MVECTKALYHQNQDAKRQLNEIHAELSSAKIHLAEQNQHVQEVNDRLLFEKQLTVKILSDLDCLRESQEVQLHKLQQSPMTSSHGEQQQQSHSVDENEETIMALKKQIFQLLNENSGLLQIQVDYQRLQADHDLLIEENKQLADIEQLREALKKYQDDYNRIEVEKRELKIAMDERMAQLQQRISNETKCVREIAELKTKINRMEQVHNNELHKLQRDNQQLRTELEKEQKQKSAQEPPEPAKMVDNLKELQKHISELRDAIDIMQSDYSTDAEVQQQTDEVTIKIERDLNDNEV